MAVVPVEKILIVVHKSIKDEFLHHLQKEGVIHITELKELPAKTSPELERIDNALVQLSVHKKRQPIETFVKLRAPINFDKFKDAIHSYDYKKTIQKIEELKTEKEHCQARVRNFSETINLLLPWMELNYDLSLLKKFKKTVAIPCITRSTKESEKIFDAISELPHSFELVNTIGTKSYYIFFTRRKDSASFHSKIIENGGEVIDFKDLKGKPALIISSLNQKSAHNKKRIQELEDKETKIFEDLSKLEVVYDLIYNENRNSEVGESLPETSRTVNIIGWIKKKDIPRLDKLIMSAKLAAYDKIEPMPDESPPVALKNPKWISPYEMLIKLYSLPKPKEYDPTPFLAIFFPIFFAICLSDAIYGIFLILFSLFLMKRITGDKSLLWILFAGGVASIFMGSALGGWCGNLFDEIGFAPLIKFRQSLMLFDPLKSPMIFLGISLGIGFLHLLIGITIEVLDSLKNHEYKTAIFANLTWLILLPSIVLYFGLVKSPILGCTIILSIALILVFSNQSGNPKLIDQLIWSIIALLLLCKILGGVFGIHLPSACYMISLPLIVIEIIRIKETKKVLGRIAWGVYNLYGISNYLSVVLSYVRLMALGMTTGVIAMAINIIAWMVIKIPVVGIVLAVVILIGGHLFNIIINCLGGFIHTMRLQYIEFFGRFYTGGSRPFRPFGLETKYVEIE